MATDKPKLEQKSNPDDYSWLKVHINSIKYESKVLLAGVIKNFRRVSWHNKKDLSVEYGLVIAVLIFLSLFFYLIYKFVSFIQS